MAADADRDADFDFVMERLEHNEAVKVCVAPSGHRSNIDLYL